MKQVQKTIRKNWLTWKDHRRELMKDPSVVKAYKEFQPEFAIIEKIIQARINKGVTQKDLAKKMKTKQSAISRLESGDTNPSLNFLKHLADALDSRLEIRLVQK